MTHSSVGFAVLALVVALGAGAEAQKRPSQASTKPKTMSFTRVLEGDQAFNVSERILTVRTEAEWRSLRATLAVDDATDKGLRAKGAPLHGIDWAKEQLVFVRESEKPSGGYRVDVRRIVETRPGVWAVEAIVRAPNPDEPQMQVMTTPWVVIRTQRTTNPPVLR